MPAWQHWTKTVSLQGCIALFLLYCTSIPLSMLQHWLMWHHQWCLIMCT